MQVRSKERLTKASSCGALCELWQKVRLLSHCDGNGTRAEAEVQRPLTVLSGKTHCTFPLVHAPGPQKHAVVVQLLSRV